MTLTDKKIVFKISSFWGGDEQSLWLFKLSLPCFGLHSGIGPSLECCVLLFKTTAVYVEAFDPKIKACCWSPKKGKIYQKLKQNVYCITQECIMNSVFWSTVSFVNCKKYNLHRFSSTQKVFCF